ncbi:MAG: hypothetical protein LW817_02270 [Candidatus Caenarcaniphilales bacterium]|jgi:hypothetical protein|nr:hypothetical protein [Candidatus Caenarcaniphilales bacterium]
MSGNIGNNIGKAQVGAAAISTSGIKGGVGAKGAEGLKALDSIFESHGIGEGLGGSAKTPSGQLLSAVGGLIGDLAA